MRQHKLLKAIIISFLFFSRDSVAQTHCENHLARAPESSAHALARVFCEGAKKSEVVRNKNWFSECGAGSREAMQGNVDDFKAFLKMMSKDLPDSTQGASNSARNLVSKSMSEPIKTIEKFANTKAISATLSLRELNAHYLIAREFAKQRAHVFFHTLGFSYESARCLPVQESAQAFCLALEKSITTWFGGRFDPQILEKSFDTAKALMEFRAAARASEAFPGANTAENLRFAANAFSETKSNYSVMLRTKDFNVLSRPDKIDPKRIRYFLEEYSGPTGKRTKELYEIPTDAKTQAMDSNTGPGKKFAQLVAAEGPGNHLVFGDVMDLGKVNYFAGGTQAGDQYLKHVALALKSNMRPGDFLFKNGGDELVVILNAKDPASVANYKSRVQASLQSDNELQSMFEEERKRRNDPNFKLTPGIALGESPIPKSADPWGDALNDAEKKACNEKAAEKGRRGEDVSKYNVCG